MKKTKMQRLMSSTNLILQGRRVLALLLVAVMVFSLFGLAGVGGDTEVVSAASAVSVASAGGKRVVLDTFDEMLQYKKNLNVTKGTSEENAFFILEIVPEEANGELGWLISGCEPVKICDENGIYNQELLQDYGGFMGSQGYGSYTNNGGCFFFEGEPEFDAIVKNVGESAIKVGNAHYPVQNTNGRGYYEKVESGKGNINIADDGSISVDAMGSGDYIWHTINSYEPEYGDAGSLPVSYNNVAMPMTDVGDRIYTTRSFDGAKHLQNANYFTYNSRSINKIFCKRNGK